MFAEVRDSRVEGDTIKPGAEAGFSPESRIGAPELDDHFLEQVLPVWFGGPVHAAYFVEDAAVLVDQTNKDLLQVKLFQDQVFNNNTICR